MATLSWLALQRVNVLLLTCEFIRTSTRSPRDIPGKTAVLKGYMVAFAVNWDERQLHCLLQPHNSPEQNGRVQCGRLKGSSLQSDFVC